MRDVVLLLHVVVGTSGLALGPAWLVARRRGHPAHALAVAYQAAVAGVVCSAAVLAVTDPGLRWLLPVAVVTEVLAVTGALARRRSWPAWRSWQPHLLGGSYVALVTGLLVAETGHPVAWLLPTVLAQPPIALAKRRLHAVAAPPAHVPA
ncbi:hypothetical protein [Modestobacter versicolor]|uniref:hypothetical protein n=1 Tax=Modestobacter versicolor TaxID=429133 RepID=UPI0034DF0AAC